MDNTQTKKKKINIIDILFILIVIAAIVFVGVKYLSQKTVKTETYIMTLHSDDAPDEAVAQLFEGSEVVDESGENHIGTLKSFTTDKSKVYSPNSEGQMIISEKEGYTLVDMEVEVQASGSDHYITIGGTKYCVNGSFSARVGMGKIWVRITDIKKAD